MDLDTAYSVKTPEDSRKLYAQWAETYDETFIKANDYVYPRTIAQHFDASVPKENCDIIVDIGCGTGAVGGFLANLRPLCKIDGFDISPEMLTCARAINKIDNSPVYRNLIEVDLTKNLPEQKPEQKYDAMVSAGTFTHGHLGASTLISLFDLVRPGGWFVIGINAQHYELQCFSNAFADSVESGVITEPKLQTVQIYGPSSPHFGDLGTIAVFARNII